MIRLAVLFLMIFTQLNAVEDVKSMAIITAIEGDVKIYRTINKEISNAKLEDALFNGDSIITGEDSEVTLFFNNGKIYSFGSNTGVKIAPPAEETQRGGKTPEESLQTPSVLSSLFAFSATGEKTGLKMLVRGEEDSMNLKIYEPGNTALITNKPDIIWGKYDKADGYTIIIQKMGNLIWQKTTKDTFLNYPEDVPELSPGAYLLKLIATKDNNQLITAERFIKILKPEVIAELNLALNDIIQQKPDSFTLHFLSARIKEEKGLVLNAIREYEVLLKFKPDEPLLHQSLFILYNKIGLPEIGNKYLDRYEELTGKKK